MQCDDAALAYILADLLSRSVSYAMHLQRPSSQHTCLLIGGENGEKRGLGVRPSSGYSEGSHNLYMSAECFALCRPE